jgi:hypothetical protein
VLDEVMKQSYQFQVYERRKNGVILTRVKGVGIEIITIDPLNGSFVLTDSGVQTFWNRAIVWTGRCYYIERGISDNGQRVGSESD